MKNKRIQKNISFSPLHIKFGEKKATSLGMTFTEWIKYLVSKEIELISVIDSKEVERHDNTQTDPTSNNSALNELILEARRLNDEDYQDLPY